MLTNVRQNRIARNNIVPALFFVALIGAMRVQAATQYWDINGATAGAGGATPSGTWVNGAAPNNWTSSSTGSSATTSWGIFNDAVFSAGADATGFFAITVSGDVTFNSLTVEEGNPTFNGGAMKVSNGASRISVNSGSLMFVSVTTPLDRVFGTGVNIGQVGYTGKLLIFSDAGSGWTSSTINYDYGTVQFVFGATSGGRSLGATNAIDPGAVVQLDSGANNVSLVSNNTFTGAGKLEKIGSGKLEWTTGAATFNLNSGGLIDVQSGTLVGGSNANEVWTNNLSDLNVASGATFDGVEANVRVDALTGGGTIKSGFGCCGYANFTFGVDNGSGTFSGVLADSSTPGNYVKTGTGTQTLTGANTYTGTTTINNGTLLVNGTHTGGGLYTVDSDATLGGTGSITAAINVLGTISPGNSIESLGTGSITFDGGTFVYEMNTNIETADLLYGGDGSTLTLLNNPNLDLIDLGNGTEILGSKFTLIAYDGLWNGGIFSGYADDSTFNFAGNLWLINYNDLTPGSNFLSDATAFGTRFVTITSTPEPASIAMWMLLSAALFGFVFRRPRARGKFTS